MRLRTRVEPGASGQPEPFPHAGTPPRRRSPAGSDLRHGDPRSPSPARPGRGSLPRRLLALGALCGIAGVAVPARAAPSPGAKIYVDRPGVYTVELERLESLAGGAASLPAERLRLTYHGRGVPHWLEDGGSGSGRRLLFVADPSFFQPAGLSDARPLAVLLATWDGSGRTEHPRLAPPPGEVRPEGLPEAEVHRRRHLEKNLLRAPATAGDADGIDTLWYWATLTQQSSSQLEVDLGDLTDRAGGRGLDLAIRLLGWSLPRPAEGMAQHHVDVYVNDRKVGECVFDGRRASTFHATVPADLVRDGPNRLRLKVPERAVEGGSEPLLDIVYVDWVEVGYRARSPLADGAAPLLLDASAGPRWLADPVGSPTSRLLAAAGWSVPRLLEGGWVLPPGEETALWIVDDGQIRRPVAEEPLSAGAGSVPADTEYVILAPPALAAGAERLAAFHRRLGRSVAVVNVDAVYDEFGFGERSPEAIRRFLGRQFERSGRLRWVLLLGDADWFEPDDRTPYLELDATDRNWIPTWTYLSRYGPAASDHFYALDPDHPAVPRFAVGRLPVVDAAALDAYVSKVIAWAGAPRPPGRPSMLMLRDAGPGSGLQQERLRERLADLPLEVVLPGVAAGDRSPADAVIAAFARHPALVYFGGHGSRYLWELGDPGAPQASSFFDRQDVRRLEPSVRQPIVLSMSCATAPFDHPSADSLGEVMVLSGDRGAVGFIGASAPLFTPPRFGEALVRGLLEEETLGEAFAAAKRRTGRAPVSNLYNLLGDPALPLSPDRPEGGGHEQ